MGNRRAGAQPARGTAASTPPGHGPGISTASRSRSGSVGGRVEDLNSAALLSRPAQNGVREPQDDVVARRRGHRRMHAAHTGTAATDTDSTDAPTDTDSRTPTRTAFPAGRRRS